MNDYLHEFLSNFITTSEQRIILGHSDPRKGNNMNDNINMDMATEASWPFKDYAVDADGNPIPGSEREATPEETAFISDDADEAVKPVTVN